MDLGTKKKSENRKIENRKIETLTNENCTIKTRLFKILTLCFFNYRINNVIISILLYAYRVLRISKDKLIQER